VNNDFKFTNEQDFCGRDYCIAKSSYCALNNKILVHG